MTIAARAGMRLNSRGIDLGREQIETSLDGLPIVLPAERHSIAGIRAYLEMLALEQQRVLCSFAIDGQSINLVQTCNYPATFSRVEAETVSLDEVPLQILRTAQSQAAQASERVKSALALICINDLSSAREVWWQMARDLKEPLLTLSLLHDGICGPANGRVSFTQLRKWQLQQLASIMQDVDESARGEDTTELMHVLEERVLLWLQNLQESIGLWFDTAAAGLRLAAREREGIPTNHIA